MSNYSKLVDYAAKDLLLSGDPAKAIKGTEVGAEFDAIATMSATKIDSGGALGTPTSGTLTNCTGLPISTGVSGLGTGVATALAVNIGSAGAPVTNEGALGTPSSGTLTNCTGLPLAGVVDSTTEALGVGSLEVGHASDTTITRVSAGVIAVEGVNLLTTATGAAIAGSAAQAFSASNYTTAQGVSFPATQNASADANTLDDYEEGTWTASVTAATVGNLSVAYTSQGGTYQKVGNTFHVVGTLVTSTFTHTTASGALRIAGFPATASSTSTVGALDYQGITKANYTSFSVTSTSGQTYATVFCSGSAQTRAQLAITELPTGGTVVLAFAGHITV